MNEDLDTIKISFDITTIPSDLSANTVIETSLISSDTSKFSNYIATDIDSGSGIISYDINTDIYTNTIPSYTTTNIDSESGTISYDINTDFYTTTNIDSESGIISYDINTDIYRTTIPSYTTTNIDSESVIISSDINTDFYTTTNIDSESGIISYDINTHIYTTTISSYTTTPSYTTSDIIIDTSIISPNTITNTNIDISTFLYNSTNIINSDAPTISSEAFTNKIFIETNILSVGSYIDIQSNQYDTDINSILNNIIPSTEPTQNNNNPNKTPRDDNKTIPSITESITISISLLQVKIKDYNLDLYIFSNTVIPNDVYLNATISVYITKSLRILDSEPIQLTVTLKKDLSKNDENSEISRFSAVDDELSSLIGGYEQDEVRVVVNTIEIKEDKKNIKPGKSSYELKVNLGENTDSQKNQDIDYESIISGKSQYDIRLYKVQSVTPCTSEFKFNLTLDKSIKGTEEKINITFEIDFDRLNMSSPTSRTGTVPRGNFPSSGIRPTGTINSTRFPSGSSGRTPRLQAECTLSSKYNNIIMCEMGRETPDMNFTMNDYISSDENKIIFISTEEDFVFPLYCYEKPPIAAIIFISSVFLFVVIVVIAIVIFLNKKGRGPKGYDAPNNISNNVLGISSGGYSK